MGENECREQAMGMFAMGEVSGSCCSLAVTSPECLRLRPFWYPHVRAQIICNNSL